MKVFFFGCIGQPGHDLHGPGSDRWHHGELPWRYELDSKLCPGGEIKFQRNQPQGYAALHHKGGWTALSWWDRSGPDKRMGCNSAVLAEGEHDFEQMKILFKEHWPKESNRQPVELFLVLKGSSND